MNKEIEEMVRVIQQEEFLGGLVGFEKRVAERLLAAGYRKQRVGQWVEDAPTVDAVEVVRCKDCKHSQQVGSFGCFCSNIQAPWFNDEYEIHMDLDDFCSYGERRE